MTVESVEVFYKIVSCQFVGMTKVFWFTVRTSNRRYFATAWVSDSLSDFPFVVFFWRLPLLSHRRHDHWLLNTIKVIHFSSLYKNLKVWGECLPASTDRVPPWQFASWNGARWLVEWNCRALRKNRTGVCLCLRKKGKNRAAKHGGYRVLLKTDYRTLNRESMGSLFWR